MKQFVLSAFAAALLAAPAFGQTPAPRPNDGAFNLPVMCDTEANYDRIVALSSLDVNDAAAVREWQTLTQQSCVVPSFGAGFIVAEEKGEMVQIELRATNAAGQVQSGGRFWMAKRHADRFRCAAVTLNARTTC
ncbi:MAG: hypothetical protein JNM89_13660 [Hyphomicrobiaceae bacterium]|nr:hypothetical protein [Hyphomicrobiaceae bacterium]